MTIYDITAWCDRAFYSQFQVETDTPERALEIAKEQVEHEAAEECDQGYHWDQFRVCDGDDNSLLTYLDDQARLAHAAPKLLAALQAILPYAKNEAHALDDVADEDEGAREEAERAWHVINEANSLIAEIEGKPTAAEVSPLFEAVKGIITAFDMGRS